MNTELHYQAVNTHLDRIRRDLEVFAQAWQDFQTVRDERLDLSALFSAAQSMNVVERHAKRLSHAFRRGTFVQAAAQFQKNLHAMIEYFEDAGYRDIPPEFVRAGIAGLRHQFEYVREMLRVDEVSVRDVETSRARAGNGIRMGM